MEKTVNCNCGFVGYFIKRSGTIIRWNGESWALWYFGCTRYSGTLDILNVFVPTHLKDTITPDDTVAIDCELKTFSYTRNDRRATCVAAFLLDTPRVPLDEDVNCGGSNWVDFDGIITSVRATRRTPKGQIIRDALISIPDGEYTSYVPINFYGKLCKDIEKFEIGNPIRIEGRLQSRVYTKTEYSGKSKRYRVMEVAVASIQDADTLKHPVNAAKFYNLKEASDVTDVVYEC